MSSRRVERFWRVALKPQPETIVLAYLDQAGEYLDDFRRWMPNAGLIAIEPTVEGENRWKARLGGRLFGSTLLGRPQPHSEPVGRGEAKVANTMTLSEVAAQTPAWGSTAMWLSAGGYEHEILMGADTEVIHNLSWVNVLVSFVERGGKPDWRIVDRVLREMGFQLVGFHQLDCLGRVADAVYVQKKLWDGVDKSQLPG